MVDVLLGLQWGDEGKGKIVDRFAPDYNLIARFQGGPNAGHTLYVEGQRIVLHQIPSGIFHPHTDNLIGGGVVLDPVTLKREFEKIAALGIDASRNLCISERAHLILPTHRALDKASETAKGNDRIGSTLKGIGPAYMDKTGRNGLRVGDILERDFTTRYIRLRLKHQKMLDSLGFSEDITDWEEEFFEALELLRSLRIVNGEYHINDRISKGDRVLAEGAQGSMLDVDFGTFPFVTSSNTISAGVCTGLGVAPQRIREVIGVTKAYCTRRCGWLDLVALRFACMVNGVTKLVMTKSDVLDNFASLSACEAYRIDGETTDKVPYQMSRRPIEPVYRAFEGWLSDTSRCTSYDELPARMKEYVSYMDTALGTRIAYVSNGPGRDQLISMPGA
jgi:adenylosuccinate synthase